MRQGSKQRRAARVKRRRRQLAELVGVPAALDVLAGDISVREACAGLGKPERARVGELVEQLYDEARR